jgi:Skp family chaperone for outer membrane proteins
VRILTFIVASLLIINVNNQSIADEKIVFLNVNYVFNNSISGKEANKFIENKIKKLEKDINKFSKNINVKKEKLISQKNILAEKDFNENLTEIDNEVKEFNKKIKIRNDEIVNLKNKANIAFIKELKKILGDFSAKNSIQMIIKQEDILIGAKNLDITNDILAIIDSNKIKLIK